MTEAHAQASRWQRVENLLIAVGTLIVMITLGQPWWLLLAVFLVFDVSALGYLVNQRVGALCYNCVHNYAGPALLVVAWAVLRLDPVAGEWLLLAAACWGFHVAVDRALGYGLKLASFKDTHLGLIGKASRDGMGE